MSEVKEGRISNPNEVRQHLSEQINRLRNDDSLNKIDTANRLSFKRAFVSISRF